MMLRCTTSKGDFDASLDVARIEVGGPDGAVLFLESGIEVRLGPVLGEVVALSPQEAGCGPSVEGAVGV